MIPSIFLLSLQWIKEIIKTLLIYEVSLYSDTQKRRYSLRTDERSRQLFNDDNGGLSRRNCTGFYVRKFRYRVISRWRGREIPEGNSSMLTDSNSDTDSQTHKCESSVCTKALPFNLYFRIRAVQKATTSSKSNRRQ